MAIEIDENAMSLDEFVKLPTTVGFGSYDTKYFRNYIKDKPYIKIGKEFQTGFLIAYTNKERIQQIFRDLNSNFFEFFPKILSPLDYEVNNASGITSVLEHPYLNLSGKGVIIGIVDTGIDYTKNIFKYEDGTSKIISIWDQNIDGDRPDELYFGSVYTRDQINLALNAENPFDIVPSVDTDGHGTFLASVAAGRKTDEYVGAAPGAELMIVKLKRANEYYIDNYFRPPNEPNLYESTDYLLGVSYIFEKVKELNVPIVLCVGMGSNQGLHDGFSILEDYFSFLSQKPGQAVITAAGNESNAKHHTSGILPRTGSKDIINVRIGDAQASFGMTILGAPYDKISIGIKSPTGEVISRIPYKFGYETTEELILGKSSIYIGYFKDINSLIFFTFENAKEGIWEITLYGDSIISGEYHAYLPMTGQVSPGVQFIKPVPDNTIVFPATALRSITCGAYNSNDNTLFVSSSWGPTLLPRMSPDFVAPGVNVRGVYPTGFGTMSGTSIAAAITAGAAAILMEWGIIQKNYLALDGDMIKILLSTGCERDEGIKYPNTKWGYGKLDLLGTLKSIAPSNIQYDKSRIGVSTKDLLKLK